MHVICCFRYLLCALILLQHSKIVSVYFLENLRQVSLELELVFCSFFAVLPKWTKWMFANVAK